MCADMSQLDYQSPPPPCPTNHDQIYSACLLALALFVVVGMLGLWYVIHQPSTAPEGRWALKLSLSVQAVFLSLMVIVLLIRWLAPRSRRAPTLALNILMLIWVPLG